MPFSEELRVDERWRRLDRDNMELTLTFNDPQMYTKPWTVMEHVRLSTNTELMEAVCNENNRDLEHLPGHN